MAFLNRGLVLEIVDEREAVVIVGEDGEDPVEATRSAATIKGGKLAESVSARSCRSALAAAMLRVRRLRVSRGA